ncbi:MAG: SpoIID/LytB domain-containing protein [Clostridiaceae bacterium]|nr:SpoIID/LytB domain-containing protein [Clostridiaceae bacterium]
MKKTKSILMIIFILTFIVTNFHTSFAFNKAQIPSYIEIGLFHSNTAKSTLHLKSINGFEVGVFYDNEFVALVDLLDYQEIILRKDAYYIGQRGNFVEYTGDVKNIDNQLNIQGPYHVQVGEAFDSHRTAYEYMQSLNVVHDHLHLAYEGKWKVFMGQYISEEEASLKAKSIKEKTQDETKIVQPSPTRVQALDFEGNPMLFFDSSDNIYFKGIEDKGLPSLIEVEGNRYRGAITAKRLQNSDMSIVNKLPLEEYLYGVVPREMPALWPVEALKAQAVVARSYALANMNRFRKSGFDICNTTTSQVYSGYDREHANSNRAVEETKSTVVTHDGKLISAFYHSNSGGHTENSENIWSQPIPYIKGVEDKYSINAPNSTWSEAFTKQEVKSLLQKNNISIGEIIDIRVEATSEFGRVLNLTIYGTEGKETLAKERSRWIFGLRSTWFTVDGGGEKSIVLRSSNGSFDSTSLQNKAVISSTGISKITNLSNIKMYNGKNYKGIDRQDVDYFIFNGKGFGHGLGMSQYGAKKMAEDGFSFKEILEHYYTGVKVE